VKKYMSVRLPHSLELLVVYKDFLKCSILKIKRAGRLTFPQSPHVIQKEDLHLVIGGGTLA
jgi:hypothetical protein